jgi:hypothetical protein
LADGSQLSRHQPKLRTAFQWLAVLMFALLALQPVLGAWVWYRDRGMIDIHAMVANTMFLVAVLLVALALVSGFARKNWITGWSLLLLVLIVAQMGLGYGSRGRPDVAAMHVPIGVFTFGVGLLLMLFAFGFTLRREQV